VWDPLHDNMKPMVSALFRAIDMNVGCHPWGGMSPTIQSMSRVRHLARHLKKKVKSKEKTFLLYSLVKSKEKTFLLYSLVKSNEKTSSHLWYLWRHASMHIGQSSQLTNKHGLINSKKEFKKHFFPNNFFWCGALPPIPPTDKLD